MSVKRSNDESETPHTAVAPQPVTTIKECTDIVLPDDVWSVIVTFVDWRGLPALACACKTTRDAARDEDMLARDKVYVLRCYLAMGGKEDTLRREYLDEDVGFEMRDEPSDDVSEWLGVKVEGGRVTKLVWESFMTGEQLTGTIPAEIGALDGLTKLDLFENQICGHLPTEIGRLTSLSYLDLMDNRLEGPLPAELGALTALTQLCLAYNNFAGEILSTLANLTNIECLELYLNNFDIDIPYGMISNKEEAQSFLSTINQG